MKIVDVNLLLYAIDEQSPRHQAARSWLERQLSGAETMAFPWVVLLAFLRLSTKPQVFKQPLSPAQALNVIDRWLEQPCASIVHPGDRHAALVRKILDSHGTAGNLVTDAHLAALAIEHGAQLNSCDSDFSRFPGLDWVNPLTDTRIP